MSGFDMRPDQIERVVVDDSLPAISIRLTAPIDPELVERAAEAAYEAGMTFSSAGVIHEPWLVLPEHWRRIYRAQARAVLEVIA